MNEIITFGQGYKLNSGIKVFVKSAKNFCDKLTIICSQLDAALLDFLKSQEVNIIDASELASKFNVDISLSPYTLKVIYFYLYVKSVSKSTNVYMCDFTDIYFQKNLFDLIITNKPYVTSENFLINKCQTNTTWINICYNQDIYGLLNRYEILNGGSILGEREGVVSLLKEMCLDMTQIISRVGNYQNIDQASLNKVVYFDKFRYNILANFEIANLAHFGNAQVKLTPNNILVNGKQPCVIHQYDVIKSLEQFLYDQFN
jgi:hypothetical protein